MKAVDVLIYSELDKRVGNHSVVRSANWTETYKYFLTTLCEINHNNNTITINNSNNPTKIELESTECYLGHKYIKNLLNLKGYSLIDNR